MTVELFLYSSSDCSLCEEMRSQLAQEFSLEQVIVRTIIIDGDFELKHRYGARVPVLVYGATELCEQKLDIDVVKTLLEQQHSA